MQPDWDYVKNTTLWQYEELLKKLNTVMTYPVIWQAYNHTMPDAIAFYWRLFPQKTIETGEHHAQLRDTILHFESAGISNWEDLLSRVVTRNDCMAFITTNKLEFEEFIDVLNYLLRWALPFPTASRELLDHENPQEMFHYEILKRYKIMKSFDILEHGHTLEGRRIIAEQTDLPQGFVTSLVHRADIARLPYVRRKTLLPVYGAGYDTLARIAAADLTQMESDLDAYFRRTQGKPFENYRSVIVLNGMVAAAQALPVIMEG
jgi:hypothetical protein